MRFFVVPAVVLLLLVLACGKNEKPPPKSKGVTTGQESGPAGGNRLDTPGDADSEARRIFAQTCATCHGADGTGQTPMAQNLNPPPRNYTDATWQASVTDDDIRKIILLGSKAVGKSEGMPPHAGLLQDKPAVVDGLVRIVRGFKK
jgi:mono/diheme cytochrome c family protein